VFPNRRIEPHIASASVRNWARHLSRLFEPFQRIDGTRTGTGERLGLGLSIVKAIADAHAATITTELPDDGGLGIEIAFPPP
jgi:signal transduction histidine kinase